MVQVHRQANQVGTWSAVGMYSASSGSECAATGIAPLSALKITNISAARRQGMPGGKNHKLGAEINVFDCWSRQRTLRTTWKGMGFIY